MATAPPAVTEKEKKTFRLEPREPRGDTQTCLPEGRRKLSSRRVCAGARNQGQKDEDVKRGQDRTKVYVVAMKREADAQGQAVSQTSLSEPGRPETYICTVDVRVQTKARTVVRARERLE